MTKKAPRKAKTPTLRVTVQQATCEMFASFAMKCPLCQVTIPANTPHRCEQG